MKQFLFLTIALSIGAIACSVKETDYNEKPLNIIVDASSFASSEDDIVTKTSVQPNAEYTNYSFLWSGRDTVGVYPDKGSQIYFEVVDGETASNAGFDGGAWMFKRDAEYRGYYPFVGDIYLDATKIPVSFTGQKQKGNDNSLHFQGYDYMYTPATSSNEGDLSFHFNHLVTVLFPWVELPAGHYTKMTLSLDQALFVTKGEYSLTAASPAIVGKEYTNSFDIDLDITFASTETLKVYVLMPPINMSGKTLTITVNEESGKSYQFIKNPSRAYVAGQVTRLKSSVSFAPGNITLDQSAITLTVGGTQKLEATVLPENAADKSVTWTSDNTEVATVDASGNVIAVAVGTAHITASPNQGGSAATCTVTVNPVEVTSVTLNKTELSLVKNTSETLTATVLPENATNKTVTWTSAATSIATVDSNGKVTAKAGGSTVITAAAGGKSATCTVTVTVPVSGVSLNKTSTIIYIGSTETLTATVSPSDATNKSVTWSSNDTSIASVDASGVITANAIGTATITVTTVDGSKSATCNVTVKPIDVTKVELNKTSMSLVKGNSETLTATVSPSNATNKTVSWSSSATSVATVDANGKVTAVGGGSATITASAGDKSATCTVNVTVPVTGVSLNKSTTSIVIGNTETLTATVAPSDATNKNVTWTSSDTAIATVDSSGKVTAVAVGSATITVKTSDGNKTATCTVTVSPIAISGISLNKSTLSLTKGSNETLTATITPNNATDKTVTWGSSNESVATVNSSGKVTAVGGGSATITATAGGKSATCTVTVTVPVISVSLNRSATTITVGNTETLIATVSPSDASNKSVTWTSSNTSVATVNTSGTVTAVAVGTATITVKTTDGNKTATCAVTVNPIAVTSVTLNKTSLTLNKDGYETLVATVSPTNATDKTVTWTSSNSSIATVDANGKVTAISGGTATITASAGGKSASCTVSVVIPVTSIRIYSSKEQAEVTSLSMYRGDTDNLTVVCYPENASNKSEYTSYSNQYWSTGYTYITVSSGSLRVDDDCPTSITKTLTVSVKGLSASCSITVLDANPSPVNLGLSVNWANKNLYATSQSESGRFYTWTEATRHGNTSQDEAQFATDGAWRLPTKDEIQELIDYCTITSTTVNGVSGVRFTSKSNTNNSIFLPDVGGYLGSTFYSASQMGVFYWSKTSDGSSSNGYRLRWLTSNHSPSVVSVGDNTAYKFVVRPVSTTVNQIEVTSVSLNKTSASINVGGTVSLTATVSPGNASDKTITWSTSNSSIATVSSSGVVTGIAPGTTYIRATSGGKTASCTVTVSKIAVTSVTLNSSSLSLNVGNSSTLTATVTPTNATYPSVTWSSTNTSVATVNSAGKVTAVGPGTTTVKATADGKSSSCSVTVTQLVTSISLNKSTTTLNIGSSETLSPTVNPSNASNKVLSWSSSAPTVASVSTAGKITAKATGTTVITASATDGSGKSASCTVTVVGSGKSFPTNGTFDQDAYITYVSNYKVEWSGSNQYIYSSTIPCGKSGTKVEMKFQVDQTSWSYGSYGSGGSGNQVYLGGNFRMSNQYLYYGDYKYSNFSSGEYLIQWNGSGVAFNSIVILTAELSGDTINSTINGVSGYQDEVTASSLTFPYLFSNYSKEYDEGYTYNYSAGVPNGARLYYVKIWNSSNQLVYFGYAAKSVNSQTGNEEYCWYCQTTNTYTFADSHKTTREPFGGGID